MPAIRKVSRDDIVNAALQVLREHGFSAVNARSVAQTLGCSTQPIYRVFGNMDELKTEMASRAVQEHTRRISEAVRSNHGSRSRYCDYGFGFVRFAEQEKQLFRWLYLEDGQGIHRLDDVHAPEIIATIMDEYGYTKEIAEKLHRDMTYYSYGIAVLANTGTLSLSDEELLDAFRREFALLANNYGLPPKKHVASPDHPSSR